MISNADRIAPAHRSEMARGWKMLLAASTGAAVGAYPIMLFSIGLFTPALMTEFGWTSQQVQLGLLIAVAALLTSLPLFGLIADKIGPRPVVIVSTLSYALVFLTLCFLHRSLLQFYLTVAIGSFVGGGTMPVTWTRMIGVWFKDQLGLAIGLFVMGGGVLATILKPFVALLIEYYGWRGAYLGTGLLPLLVGLPMILFWFRSPPLDQVVMVDDASAETSGVSFGTALRDWRFWALSVAFFPYGFTAGAMLAHMETMLRVQGVAPSQIVWIASLIGISLVIGSAGGGWLLDRLRASLFSACLLLALVVSCFLLTMYPLATIVAICVVVVLGINVGVQTSVASFLAIRMFGLRAYGRVFGILVFAGYGSGAVGPVVFAHAFDHDGNYNLALRYSSVAVIVSAMLIFALGSARERLPAEA